MNKKVEYVLQRDFILGKNKFFKDIDSYQVKPEDLAILQKLKMAYEAGTNLIIYRIIKRTITEEVIE